VRSIAFALTLVFALLPSRGQARGVSKLDRSQASSFRVNEPAGGGPCSMLELFSQVARQARVSLGYENVPGCWSNPRAAVPDSGGRMLQARTAHEAFDEVAALTGAFSWQEIDGVVVVRPVIAWQEAGVLNVRVDAFQLTNVSLDEALCRALDVTKPRVRASRPQCARPLGRLEIPMSVDFAGGSLMDALTAIVRAKGGAEWHVGYSDERTTISISSLNRLGSSASALIARRGSNPAANAAPAL
jgi:hypothetical protein